MPPITLSKLAVESVESVDRSNSTAPRLSRSSITTAATVVTK
jgi:hypothetical protein